MTNYIQGNNMYSLIQITLTFRTIQSNLQVWSISIKVLLQTNDDNGDDSWHWKNSSFFHLVIKCFKDQDTVELQG